MGTRMTPTSTSSIRTQGKTVDDNDKSVVRKSKQNMQPKNLNKNPAGRTDRLLTSKMTVDGVREDTRKASDKNSTTLLTIPLEGLPKKLKEDAYILKYDSRRGDRFRELPPEDKPKARHGDETRLDTIPPRSANQAWDRLIETETITEYPEERTKEKKIPDPDLDKEPEEEKEMPNKPNDSERDPEKVAPLMEPKPVEPESKATTSKGQDKNGKKSGNNLMPAVTTGEKRTSKAKSGNNLVPAVTTEGKRPSKAKSGNNLTPAPAVTTGKGKRTGKAKSGNDLMPAVKTGGKRTGKAARQKVLLSSEVSSSSVISSSSSTSSESSSSSSESEDEPEVDQRIIGVLPPRAGVFRAPFIQIPQPGSYAAGGNLDDEEGLTFGFEPRANFRTEVTFTIEPNKRPMWKTMMGCGFNPVIYCSVPPACISETHSQPQPRLQPCCCQKITSSSDCSSSSSSDGTSCGTSTECGSSESDTGHDSKPDNKRQRSSSSTESTYGSLNKSQGMGGGDVTTASPVPSAESSTISNEYD